MNLEDLSDNTEQTKTPKTRSEYLHGKTELSDVDIIHILDLPVEKRSINNEIYTDKSYKELKNNPEELSSLTENLKTKPEYLKYHSSYIAKSKLLYQESDVLCNEIPCIMVLNQLKKTSYLLPYEYASNKSGAVITSADALKSNTFTDFKRVFNSRLKKLIEKGITQGKDIFFLINNKKLSHDEIKSQLIRFLNNRTSENKEGTYLFFSEKNFVCYSFESDKNGFITELPEYDLKEIRAAISSKPLTPSRESEKTSDSLASNLNITQEKSDVNELFSSLLLRGEITLLERKKDIENRNERYLDAVTSLEKLTPLIQSDSIKESNNKFVKKQKESRFYKDVQNLFVKTKTSNKPQENKMENISSENISYENEEMSKAAAIKERNQQKKLTTQMILDQEDKEQMESISATMKSATKDFMDLNATPITEERIDFLKTPTGNKSELSENEWKFSHSSEFKELYGDWEGKIKKDFLLNDDTVSKLTGDEFSRKEGFTLTEQVEQYFNEMNNSVESPFFGKVVLDREGADDSLSHRMGRLKAVAYAGVPNVIKNGVIIDSDLNHKDRGYNSYVIAAPIKIADKNYICEVVLKQNKQENRFYLHEVTEQKKFLERAFVTNPAQKPAHQGTLSNILEKTVSVNYEISCPMGINGEPEKTFVQNEYRKSLDEFQSKNQNTAAKITDSVSQEENPFKNADPDQTKELYEQAEAVEKMQQEAAANAVLDENGNTHYQTDEELLQEYKQKYPESSLSISEDTRNELENVFSQIDDYLDKGIVPQERRFTLPKVSSYLKQLGSDETAISLPVSVIKKARETHGLSNEEIKNSLTRLYDPVAVFDTDKTKSENKLDSKLILTDEFSELKPIALALNTNTQIQVEENGHRKFIEVQDIRSIHDRTLTAKNGTDLVKHWTENGLCRYVDDKKISEWSTVARVSFPIEALHSDKNNILTKSEVVNPQNSGSVKQEEERTMKSTENFESQEYWKNQFQQDNAETFKAIDDYLEKGIRPKNDEFIFEKVPEILKAANVSENEIVIKTSIINKAKNEHSISDEEIKNSIKNIASPVLVFNSDKTTTENKKESFLCLTDTFAENGKPIAFSMNLDSDYEKSRSILNVNQITSIHDRTLIAKNGTDLIQKWTENGLCRYVDDKKISEWQLAARVQFPLAVLHSDINNINLSPKIVNDTDYQEIRTFSEFAEQQKAMEKEYQEYLGTISPDEESSRRIDSGEIFGKLENQQSKEELNVATYKFQSGETLDEIIQGNSDFSTETALLDNLIDNSIREVYEYATNEEKSVLRQFAAFRNDYDTDMKNLAVQTDCISRWIAAEHWNPEKQEFQKEYVNKSAIKEFPYKLPWEMKEIEAQVLQTKNETIDKGIESIQVNGGMSEAAIEAEIRSQEKDHHEVEEYNDGQLPLQVVAHTDFNYFNSDKLSFKEYIVRTDASVVQDLIEKNADSFNETNSKLEENAIPCIIVRKSVNPEIPDQFLLSKYENNNLNKDEIAKQAGKFASKEIKIENTEFITQIKNVIDWNDKQNKTQAAIPKLKIYRTLKEDDVKNLEVISDQEFSDIVDSIILNDYKNIPNAIRLPNLNEQLSEKLGLEKDSAFILKKNATHIRPDRKGGYGQAFDAEEYRRIPEILRNADFAVVDTVFQNFQIVFDDKNDGTKINKLVFNKDELGNYLVTLGKVDRESAFSEERNPIVAVGVAPTIQTLRTSASSTALRASTTMGNESIAQSKEKASSLSKNYAKVAVGVEPTIWRAQNEHPIATMLRSSTTLATEETIAQAAEKSINEQKIKMPDQLVYAAAKVGQVIEQRVQNELGIVNPTRDDRLSTISVPLNKDYNEDFSLSTEKNMSETQKSINEQKTKLQIIEQEDKEQLAAIVMTARKTIKESLAQNAEPLVEVDFSKANYDRLFPRAIVQTPVETVKLGENQFEKLDARDRKRFLLATFQTLATPDLVIDEEREGKHSHNYIKSFVFDEKTKTIQDVVVNINGENVSITAHPRDINNIVNKIKMPDQLVYAAARVGQVIEQRTQEAQSIVNPTRDDRLSTISVPLNKEYNENFALSTVEKLLETEKNAQKATASDFQQIEPALQKKFDKLKAAIKSREEQDIQDISAAEEIGNKKQAIRSKSDIIRQAGKDFLKSEKEGIAPFFNAEDDFQRIIMHPQAIINASNGLPFSGESQLLAQIYHQRQRMEGEVVTSIAGAKAAGTIVLDTPESRQKNFALTDTSSLAEKNAIVRTRYFMPESCEEPDKIYAHTLQRQRPDKIRSYRDLIRHFENIPNGQKEIFDIRIRIAHEHLKEIQSRFAIKEKRVLSVDEIEERKNFLRNYFERLPADYRNSERSAFEDTFGIQLNSEKNLEINLQRDFKDIDFAELKKNTKKSIELENRKLSDFIEKNTMEDKKLATLLSDEYKSLSKEEKMTVRNLKIEAIGIKEPETFLGKYLAACNTNAEFITDKETVEEVKKNLVKKLEENFKLEKYDILKEIGQQAQSIGNETTKKISFEKAHSNNKSLEKTQSPDKEISLIGMGK